MGVQPIQGGSVRPMDVWDALIRIGILLGLGVCFYLGLAGPAFRRALSDLQVSHWTRIFIYPSLIWGAIGLFLLALRTFLWWTYRPFPQAKESEAPSMTVIIPAYNEGAMVQRTIDSVAGADYPPDRLEIIVIDDGSKDDTWDHIQQAALRHPSKVRILRFPENRGKRAALEAGFQEGSGELFITIDSDSIIEPQTLLAMAGPFRDPKIGAVAGKVLVNNKAEGIIPKMLHVRFILSFDFLRAAQSRYGTVYCCPGALSGYRASVVSRVLDAWRNQKFLGERCTYGEDRAMTNFILGQGFNVVYQRTGVVHTNVPSTYSRLCRMYLRWERSFIREELHYLRIVWKRPFLPRMITCVETVVANLRFVIGVMNLALLVILISSHPYMLIRIMFVIGGMASLNTLYYFQSERSWDFVYGIIYSYFSFYTLFWVFPAAFFTVRSRSWMTR